MNQIMRCIVHGRVGFSVFDGKVGQLLIAAAVDEPSSSIIHVIQVPSIS